MNRGNYVVEQVNIDGEIVIDYDWWLTAHELFMVISNKFPNVEKMPESNKYFTCERNSVKYMLRVKNITYLGKPHKAFRKRYQIPDDLEEFYNIAREKKMIPLMIGVYTYEDLSLFVSFSISTYICGKHHNSSAHVYSTDLQQVLLFDEDGEENHSEQYGYYKKVDINGNEVVVFDSNSIDYFLDVATSGDDSIHKELLNIQEIANQYGIQNKIGREFGVSVPVLYKKEHLKIYGRKLLPDKTKNIILNYFENATRTWEGQMCYMQMFSADYRNKNQAEWPGFYLEYHFEDYLKHNNYEDTMFFAQEKEDGGVDLDLFLSELQTYADLKAHSIDKNDIPGNKKETIEEVLSTSGQVIYIVCEHDTLMDSEQGLIVTEYWNKNKTNRKPKQNLHSYQKRMKGLVTLKKVQILSINHENVKYLKGFTQGKNSNGKPRKVKIMIDGKNIDKFRRITYELS